MAIAERDVASQDEYATKEEVIDTLERLSQADFLRLRKIARLYSFGKEDDLMDLVQESIRRMLSGTRRWHKSGPEAISFNTFIAGVIKSVADYENKRGTHKGISLVVSETDVPNYNSETNLIESHPAFDDSIVERELVAKEKMQEIESLFLDDERALAVIMGWADGIRPSEIQDMFDMTKTQYDSAVKKVNRRMTKFNNNQ